MFDEIGQKIGGVGRRDPIKSVLLLLLSAGYVASVIIGPILFKDGLNDVKNADKDKAYKDFAGTAALLLAFLVIPLVQDRLLTDMGNKLGDEILEETLESFFNQPRDTKRNPKQGQNYKLVDRFGGDKQPGGFDSTLLPVILHALTNLAAMIALVIVMGVKLGSIAWIPATQLFLFLMFASAMTKPLGDAIKNFIKKLYDGFAHTIVFANNYVNFLILNLMKEASRIYMKFIKEELNPSASHNINIGIYAQIFPVVLGAIAFFGSLAWGVKHTLSFDHFILLAIYSLALTALSMSTMSIIIAAVSSIALFVFGLLYNLKGKKQNLPEFSVDQPANISVKEVSFAYPNASAPVFLKKLNFELDPGSVGAVLGRNGSGKSTLMQMFCGFIQPTKGAIKIAGQDVTKIDLRSYRKHCAFILQDSKILEGEYKYNIAVRQLLEDLEPKIIDGTYRDNIAMYHPDIDDSLIKQLMTDVGLVKVTEEEGKMPREEPYDLNAIIGFNREGPTISGGEQQKVIIIRACLDIIMGERKKSPIKFLFLDEVTKALDKESEPKVLRTIARLVKQYNVTTIVVTHDLETLEKYFAEFGIKIQRMSVTEEKVAQLRDVGAAANRSSFHATHSEHVALDIAAEATAPRQGEAKNKERIDGGGPRDLSPV